jgi:transposase
LQALELVKSGSKSINEIERDLGITPGLLHKWKARMKVDGPQAFAGKGRLKEDEELIRRLKREIEVLRQERAVLKKALAIFSSPEEKSTPL